MILSDAMTRRLMIVVCLTVPFLMISMVYQFLDITEHSAVITQFRDSSQAVTSLPFSSVRLDEEIGEGPTISGEFDLSKVIIGPQDYIFIPSLSGQLVLHIDGRLVYDNTNVLSAQQLNVSSSILLREPFDATGPTKITFGLYSNDSLFLGMSRIFVGSKAAMENVALRYEFYSSFLRILYWGIEAFCIVTMILLFAFRAIDLRMIPLLFLFSYFLALQSPNVLKSFVDIVRFVPIINCLGFLVPWSLFAFYREVIGVGKSDYDRRHLFISLVAVVVAFLILMISPKNGPYLNLLITFPLIAIALFAVSFIALRKVVFEGQIGAAVFAFTMLSVGVSVMHDLFVRMGIFYSSVLVNGPSAFNFFLCAVFLLMSRIKKAQDALQRKNESIEKALALRTAQLAQEFKMQAELREQNAINIENQRITRDLHDGVLTYVAMIKSLVETGSAENQNYIMNLTKSAIHEIRVILEVNLLEENSVFVSLSVLRSQVTSPLRHSGVDVHWNLLALLDQTKIDHKHALNLFRIMQEAINNAVQRAYCTSLIVETTYDQSQDAFVIAVTNTGGHALAPDHRTGHGIRNMRRRAALIGAEFVLESRPGGGRLELRFN